MIGTIRVSDVMAMAYETSTGKPQVSETLADARTHPQYPDVLESVRRYGVTAPILIRYEELCNGRHRIAACVELGIEWVDFTDDPAIGWAFESECPEEKEAQNCE